MTDSVANRPKQDGLARNALPNGLIDNVSIGLVALFMIAFRASQGPTFSLNASYIRKRFGIGATAFNRAIRALKQTGWYHRHQPRAGRKHQFAMDGIVDQREGRAGFLIARNDWFSQFDEIECEVEKASLVKTTAVLIFMLAQAPGLSIGQRRIAKRFDLSRPTASKLLRSLEAQSRIHRIGDVRQAGRFLPTEYTAHPSINAMSTSPTALSPPMDCVGAHLGLSATSSTQHLNNLSIQLSNTVLQHEAEAPIGDWDDFDPDDWIGSHSYFDVNDDSALAEAAAVPCDQDAIKLLKSNKVVRRLKKVVAGRINPKLLSPHGLKGFWTLVNFVNDRDPWLTQTEAIDHIIDVCGQKLNDKHAWLNGWGLIGIELDANDPAYRNGQPSWLCYFRDRANTLGLSEHFGDGLMSDREGLEKFLRALKRNQNAINDAFVAGLWALWAKGERLNDGRVWETNNWGLFERAYRLKMTRDDLMSEIPDDLRSRRISDEMWRDLLDFDELITRAASLIKVRKSILQGIDYLEMQRKTALRWSFFDQHL
ncbi:MAG: hypothetical protein AAF346_00140 [Pseudomonadota bacterium]